MATSRARRIEWLGGPHSDTAGKHMSRFLARYGLTWLTDEQLDEIVRKEVSDWRFTSRLNRQNRARAALKAGER